MCFAAAARRWTRRSPRPLRWRSFIPTCAASAATPSGSFTTRIGARSRISAAAVAPQQQRTLPGFTNAATARFLSAAFFPRRSPRPAPWQAFARRTSATATLRSRAVWRTRSTTRARAIRSPRDFRAGSRRRRASSRRIPTPRRFSCPKDARRALAPALRIRTLPARSRPLPPEAAPASTRAKWLPRLPLLRGSAAVFSASRTLLHSARRGASRFRAAIAASRSMRHRRPRRASRCSKC